MIWRGPKSHKKNLRNFWNLWLWPSDNDFWRISWGPNFQRNPWALLESLKNDFPMVRATTKSQKFLKFSLLFEKWPPGKSWKHDFSDIPWTLGPSGPSLDARAQNSIQDSLNESSVRPNGTPVMPILRSRFGTPGGPGPARLPGPVHRPVHAKWFSDGQGDPKIPLNFPKFLYNS